MCFDRVASVIEKGDISQLRRVLETGLFENINERRNPHGQNFLTIACKSGNLDCLKVLLESQTNITYFNYEYSVLRCACRNGGVDMVRYVIARGLELSDKVIMNACSKEEITKNMDTIAVLDEFMQKLDINYYGNFLFLACRAGNLTIIRYSFEREVEVSSLNKALHITVEANQFQAAEYLINRAAECNIPIIDDVSLLTSACFQGNVNIVRLLLIHGANPNAADQYEDLPLEFALHHPAVLKVMLEGGLDPNVHFNDGRTALLNVIVSRYATAREFFPILLEHGADPNLAYTHTGDTPLMTAALATHTDPLHLVAKLLEYGADVTQVNRDGKSVLDILGSDATKSTTKAAIIDLCEQYKESNLPGAKPLLK